MTTLATTPTYNLVGGFVLPKLLLILTIIAVLLMGSGEIAQAKHHRVTCKDAREAVKFYRGRTWHWQDRQYVSRTPTSYSERWARGCPYLRWTAKLWIVRARDAKNGYVRWTRLNDPVSAITRVFGNYASQALAVARCESGLYVYATNGQYLGLFQMGAYARSRYGHSYSAYGQARAAFQYFADAGYDWSPWECKPW